MPRAARVMPAMMSGPRRALSKGSKPCRKGSDEPHPSLELCVEVMVAAEHRREHLFGDKGKSADDCADQH